MSAPPPGPNDPPPLTPEQKHRILYSPLHRKIKRQAYALLGLGLVGGLMNVTGLTVGAALARALIDADRWFIFHYTAAGFLSLLWAAYTFIFERDVKCLGWPDQLQIDIGWMMFAPTFSICFMLYIFRKMRTYGILDVFIVACSNGCSGKLAYVKISPLIFSIFTLLFAAVQLFLSILLYKNPIINPPLDSHGMPVAQNPETGETLPLDANGQPILPDWLKPPSSEPQSAPSFLAASRTMVSSQPYLAEKGLAPEESSEESALSDEDDEKRPLRMTEAGATPPVGLMEMGKKGRRKASGRR